MQQYAMLIIGAIILAAGIYMKDKKVANIAQERGIALATYGGWVLFCIPLSKLATPIFAVMPGNWPQTGVLVLQVIMFLVGAEIFMKKPFEPGAGEKYKKTNNGNKGKNNKGKGSGKNSKGANAANASEAGPEKQPKKGGFKKLN